jgi:hypothetical protein
LKPDRPGESRNGAVRSEERTASTCEIARTETQTSQSKRVLIALARDEVVQFLTTGTFNLLSKTKFTLRLSGVIQSEMDRNPRPRNSQHEC